MKTSALANPSRYWLGRKRPDISGKNNYGWKGGLVEKKCLYCDKQFFVPKCSINRGKYCCRDCANKGKDRGLSTENEKIRHCNNYKIWRTRVFERDNYTCFICNERGGTLHAHHIENFSSNKELRFDINNGITLCKFCHNPAILGSFHNIYGTKNNNKDQLIEFINNKNIITEG